MNLINVLKGNVNARKVFGKKEIEIIIKQIEGKDLTQSEKNRLSKDIRKKFEFIKEISELKDEFKLEKNLENKKIIDKSVKIILNDELSENIKAILLFGSFADNSFTNRSDIDICVVFRKDLSLKDVTKFRIRVSGELPEKVDVQVFNILPKKVKKDIARNHKVLYNDKEYDNIDFTLQYMKDDSYFMRMNKIFGEAV